jgi:serine/threonine protein kinase
MDQHSTFHVVRQPLAEMRLK